MKTKFYRNLRRWRTKRRLSQTALAQKAGLTQATLSRLENNLERPQLETLFKIAEALNVDLPLLLSEEPTERRKWDRHEIDAVARAIISGKRELSAEENRLADQAASLMINLLRSHDVAGRYRVGTLRSLAPRRKENVFNQISEKTFKLILARVRKHLPSYAVERISK